MKILKKHILLIPLLFTLFTLFGADTYAQTVYDWVGTTSTDWTVASNWQVGGVTATAYPGQASSTDIADIGVNVSCNGKKQPSIILATTTINIGALNIGDNLVPASSSNINTQYTIILTVNGTLNITNALTQMHSAVGIAGSGLNYNWTGTIPSPYTRPIFNYMIGAGTITCGSVAMGDNTVPGAANVINVTTLKMGSTGGGSKLTLTVNGNFVINSPASKDGSNNIISESLAEFSFSAGTLNIYGQIVESDVATPFNALYSQYSPLAFFSVDLGKTADSPVLNLYNANPVSIQTGAVRNNVDFYNVATSGGTGTATVNYAGTGATQDVPIQAGTGIYNFIDHQYILTNTIATTGTLTGGTGYVNGTYYNVPLTGGTGAGAIANITVSGGSVTAVTPTSGIGSGYAAGDALSASNTNLGGSGSGFSIAVATVATTTFNGVYQNLSFSGSGTKSVTPVSAALSVIGNFTLGAGTETVDISTHTPILTIGGNYSSASGTTLLKSTASAFTISGTTINGGTFTHSGSAPVTFNGTFTNTATGIYNQSSTGTVTANSAASNSGTYNQSGSGSATFNGTFTSTGAGIYNMTGTGPFTAASTTGNAGTFNQSSTVLATFTGTVTNTGTINQTNTGNILFSAAFTNSGSSSLLKQTGTGTITFSNSLTNGGTVTQGGGPITVASTVTNTGTLTLGSANFTFTGDYSNTGTFTAGTGTAIFNGTGVQHMTDGSSAGTVFNNCLFSGDANKNMQTGNFYVSSTGVMTLSGNITHVVSSAANDLTFLSDVNGSATLAQLPNNCTVNGTVTVQRYIPGGSSGSRGYRLLSSAVSAGKDGFGNQIYSINYLLNSTYISGLGFPNTSNSKTGNPSLYLFRENLSPLYTTFLNSNYIGINSYSASPTYSMNDATYPTANIPIGNGYLFYFRGGATTVNPFVSGSLAEPAALASTGTLNEGAVSVTSWVNATTGTAGLLYSTVSGSAGIEGMNLVGNPYPSTIDWTTFNTTTQTSGIYGSGLSGTIYLLNPGSQAGAGNYGSYIPGVGGTNNATNLIASGVGFFVQATSNNAILQFNESAKVNTQPSGNGLFLANKQTLAAIKQQVRMVMQLDSINSDETLINFNANTKTGYIITEDARYRTGTGKVNLASMSSDNVALAINQLPLALKGDTIKLKVGATASGTYTLKMEAVTGIPQIYAVWLKDAFTKDSVNMRTTPNYSFNVNTGDTTTFGASRFTLMVIPDPALAYKLISFDAVKTNNNKQVELTWKTQNEQNTTNFTVERSNDNGKTFDGIGSVLSTGVGTYSLLDKDPLKGDNMYRLKQVDYFGNITYSSVIDLQFSDNNGNGRLTCYPNPAITTISLSFDPKSQGNTTYDIRVTNSTGMIVKFAQVTEPSWQSNVSNLLTGTYLIQVTDKKDNSVVGQAKFVKL